MGAENVRTESGYSLSVVLKFTPPVFGIICYAHTKTRKMDREPWSQPPRISIYYSRFTIHQLVDPLPDPHRIAFIHQLMISLPRFDAAQAGSARSLAK